MSNNFKKSLRGAVLIVLIISIGLIVGNFIFFNSAFAYMPGVRIEKVSQDPDPGLPNRLLKIRLKVVNYDRNPVNLTIELIPEWPFKKYRVTKKNIHLMGYQLGTFAQIIEFYVLVNDSVPPGEYKLKLKYYDDAGSEIITEIPIEIENDEVLFDIPYIKITPDKVIDEGNLEFNLNNIGTISAKDVAVKLQLPNGFSIKDDTNTKYYLTIGKNQIKTVRFHFEIDPNLKPGVYNGKIILTYYNDDRTKKYSSEYDFGIIVDVKNKVYSFIEHYSYDEKKNKIALTIDVVNKGTDDIKYVKVEILPNKDYEIIEKIAYIGDVDAGDYESIDLSVKPKKENITLRYVVEWADYFNREFKQTFEDHIKVKFPKREENKEYMKYVYALILLLLAIFWIFMFVDAVQSEEENKVKKWLWIIIIVLTLPLGAILYYLFGRKKY